MRLEVLAHGPLEMKTEIWLATTYTLFLNTRFGVSAPVCSMAVLNEYEAVSGPIVTGGLASAP